MRARTLQAYETAGKREGEDGLVLGRSAFGMVSAAGAFRAPAVVNTLSDLR